MLTAQELARLMELASKGANLTDAEKAELATLQAKSIGKTDAKEMTEGDLKAAVESAVKNATAGSVKTEDVQKIVDAAIKSIPTAEKLDQKSLADAVAAAVKPGITAEDVKNIVTEGLKNVRQGSKMAFNSEDDDAEQARWEVPVGGDRKGNLDLWKKQFLNILTGKSMNADIPESMLTESRSRSERAEKFLHGQYRTKGITTTGVGLGKEWMAVGFSTQLLSQFYVESQIAQAFLASEIDMPTDNYTYPLDGVMPRFTLGGENTDITETEIGTDALTLKAAKLVGKISYSYEAEEDALIPVLPQMLKNLGEAAAMDYEDVVINGDTAGTQDAGTPANSALKAWDGIRKLALAQAALKKDLATGGISVANIGILRKALKKYGLNPKNVLIIAGVAGYNDLVMLDETLTAEKAGANARLFTGMAPNLLGMDIVPSAAMREDLNASGKYDGTTTTKGSIILLWKPGYLAGSRRGFTIETDVNKHLQKKWVIASFRRAFKPIRPLSAVQSAVVGFNFNSGA